MKIKKLVSLLVDPINVATVEGDIIVIPPSGETVGCKNYEKFVSKIKCKNGDKFFITHSEFSNPEKIPDPEDGVFYIVPRMVFDLVDRDDIVTPGKVITTASGTVYHNGFDQ